MKLYEFVLFGIQEEFSDEPGGHERSSRMAQYDILVTGDGTNLLQTIGLVLKSKSFAVKTTTGQEAALEALLRKNYDLVVAKLTTDNLEGLDILKRAKRLNPEVKVIAVTDNHDAIFPREAYEIEVDDYLLMPLSPPELWRRVSRCLRAGGREPSASASGSEPQGRRPSRISDDAQAARYQGSHDSKRRFAKALGPGLLWGNE